jgi:hypothetical protein
MGNQRVIQSKTTEVNLQKNSAIARSTPNPSFSTRTPVHPLLQLQRQIGNQAVSRLIQAKLKVGKPNDTYEQEADRVADTVMRMPNPLVQRQTEEEDKAQAKPLEGAIAPFVQRQAEENKEETAQTKPLAIEITPWVQRQAAEEKKEEPVQMLQRQATEDKKEEPVQAKEGVDGTTDVTPELENRIQTMRGGGQSLSESSLAFFEPRFGYNFRNVRVHTDSQASEISLKLNAQAFTIGQDIFFSAGHYEPNTSKGQWLLAHELTHTVQQQPQPLSTAPGSVQASTKSAIARSSVPSLLLTNHRGAENTQIREEGRGRSSFLLHSCLQTDSRLLVQRQPLAVSSAAPHIQRSVLDRVLNRVADWAANIPGFTLLTVILGRNPINGRSVERNATNVLRGFMGLIPGGDLLFRGLQASGVIDRVFAWVNQQLSQFGLTPSTILERFRRVDLSASDIFHPWDAIDRFRDIFLNPTLNSIRAFASTFGSRVIAFIKEAILRPVGQFARRIPLYPLLTVLLGRDPITGETVERNATNVIHGILTIIPGGEQVFQNLRQSGVIERAFAWFNAQITRLNLTWNAIRELFSRAWDSLSINDLVSPVAAFERIGNIFAPFVQSIRTFVPAAIGKVAEFIFEGVLSLAGGLGQRVLGIVRRAGGVISQIINNPIGFVGNLVGAVRRGFQQFSNNILTHLRAGLIGWLFGALQGAGLTLPERFDLRGIVSIVMQVLGLTYARLRAILVRLLGEERVSRAEQVFDFLVTIATQGLSAAWERIVEFAGNLQEMVIGGIRDWVARTVIGQAIARLVTLFNPAGAVIQAIMAIYNTVVFFIERAQQIAALAEAVFGSIASIAAGNISAAASYVERTMARTIPVVISFLARFIGLGNVSEQIRNIIQRIQAPIENAMNRVATWIATQVTRLGGAIVSGARTVGQRVMSWIGIRKPFTATDGSSHTLFFQGQGMRAVLTVATTPAPVNSFLQSIRSIATSSSDANIRTTYQTAVALANDIDIVRNRVESGTNPRQSTDIDELNQKMERLTNLLPPLIPLAYPAPAAPSGGVPVTVGELIKITSSNLVATVTAIEAASVPGMLMVKFRIVSPRQERSTANLATGFLASAFGRDFTKYTEEPRMLYLGSTPSKDSRVGQQVKARMQREGKFRVHNGVEQILYSRDGQWWNIQHCDMGHIIDAVAWWNSNGRLTGARSSAVISFMNDPDNYELEPSGPNQARGTALAARGVRYLPPVV